MGSVARVRKGKHDPCCPATRGLDGHRRCQIRCIEVVRVRFVRLRCRLFGHKVPGSKRFPPDRYRRCERCGERVLVNNRWET